MSDPVSKFHVWRPAGPAGTDPFYSTEAQAKSVAAGIGASHPLWKWDARIEHHAVTPSAQGFARALTELPRRAAWKGGLLKAIRRSDSGAVLIVSLALLVALTQLSRAATRTARLEERMASNEQIRMRAFTAVETGLSQAIESTAAWDLNGAAPPIGAIAGDLSKTRVDGSSRFIAWSAPPTGSLYSATRFKAANFDFAATGRVPNGIAAIVQGGAVRIAPRGE